MNIFEQATKQRLRFASVKGQLATEDLWDLSLEQLDEVAKTANKAVENSSEKSFITQKATADKKSQLRFDVVMHIINHKLEDQEKRKLSAERKVKRDRILEVIAGKQDAQLERKSVTVLMAELEKLEEEEA